MLQRLLLVCATVCAICAMAATGKAQCASTLPFNFVNGTVADATQVMANFNASLQCAQSAAPTVPNLSTLSSQLTASYPKGVLRNGYTKAGDAPPLFYLAESGTCASQTPARVNDTGSCINTTSGDGNSFFAVFPAAGVSPMEWGAKGDGVTDDTTAVQAAITALTSSSAPGVLALGNNLYSVTSLTINGTITIIGTGPNNNSGFQAGAANANLITIASGHPSTVLTNFRIAASFSGGGNTSGTVITNNSSNTIVSGLYITDACTAISENGNSNTYRDNKIYSQTYDQTNCALFRVGFNTTGAGTIDPRFVDNTIQGAGLDSTHNASAGFFISDCGGCIFVNNDVLFSAIGTAISPSTNQSVSLGFWNNTIVGDSTSGNTLDINTGAASGKVNGLQFNGIWASTAGDYKALGVDTAGDGVFIHNTGGGTIDGIHFVGSRFFNESDAGIAINAGAAVNVTIDSSTICGASTSGVNAADGIALLSGTSKVSIRNNTILPQCDGQTPGNNMHSAISLAGSNNDLVITGNVLAIGTVAVSLATSITNGASIVLNNNIGLSDQLTTIGSATTIDLGASEDVLITGATTITNILSGWAGRQVTITTQSNPVFNTGGTVGQNLCTALSSSANATYVFHYVPGLACWAHSP